MKQILLLGSNGYIGSFIRHVMTDRYNITCVDTCWFNDPHADCIVKDYRDLDKSFIDKFDVVILLAGHSSVKMCEGKFRSAFENNVTNFINLLSKITTQKFIYASSSSVYGSVGGKTVDESFYEFKPYNQYDISKHIIDLYAEKSDIEYYGLRFGTVNGYAPIMRNDVMINAMTTSALDNDEIKLYIKDIMRPILGIEDLGRALVAIIESDIDQRGIYNLASFNKTAEQIAYEVSNETGVKVRHYESDLITITNIKTQTKTYNFSISTKKFEKSFDFKFRDTVASITNSIVCNYTNIKQTTRAIIYDYV